MRAWIYNRISGLPNRPASWVGKDIKSSAAADQPVAPFIIISMGLESTPLAMPAESRTQEIPFTAWVHDNGASMLRIDEACVWLKNELPFEDGLKVGNMSIFRLKWELTGEDAFDDHFKTNVRPVRFSMMTRR
jgi:hypothetical protein